MAGEFCYVKNTQGKDIIYLKCEKYEMCDGTAKINVSGEVLETMRAHTWVVEQNTLVISLAKRQ